ncbi:MAG TPA: DUF4190 domain-containing protein [Candidatus Sulfotelmatobacter sp.]|nr:DUF4190 domain-containing protein [Candidatus Sulfotelmatobacter sp.]
MSSFCAACGNTVADGDRFCRICGRDAFGAAAVAVVGSGGTPMAPTAPAETSGKAIISLVCGLLLFIPLAFIAAIVFGHLALSEIRKSAGRLKGEGMAIAGLVLGYVWIAGIPIILITAAIAIPNLLRARMAADESSAVASVRRINVAEVDYSATHPNVGFTCSLSDLSGEIDGVLVSGQKNGYVFQLSGCTAAEGELILKYHVVAYPIDQNVTGRRAFCSDETAVVRAHSSGSPQGCMENGAVL